MSFESPDILIYEGEQYFTSSFPLESFYRERKLTSPFTPIWPNLHRGYRAEWLVQDDRLFLLRVQGKLQSQPDEFCEQIGVIFPMNDGGVFADWYSGQIRAGRGDKRYRSPLSRAVREHVIYLNVERGRILSIFKVDNSHIGPLFDEAIRNAYAKLL